MKVILEKSVYSALLDLAYSDTKLDCIGYCGGKREKDAFIVSHFYPCERDIEELLSNSVKEAKDSLRLAIEYFDTVNSSCIGWYRSVHPLKSMTPSQQDYSKVETLSTESSPAFALLISVSSSAHLQMHNSTLYHKLAAFQVTTSVPHRTVGCPIYIRPQAFMSPSVLQQLYHSLQRQYQETQDVYQSFSLLEKSCSVTAHYFAECEYATFLSRFYRKQVLQLSKSVDQDFRIVSEAKHKLKKALQKRRQHLREMWSRENSNLPTSDFDKLLDKYLVDNFEQAHTKLIENQDEFIQNESLTCVRNQLFCGESQVKIDETPEFEGGNVVRGPDFGITREDMEKDPLADIPQSEIFPPHEEKPSSIFQSQKENTLQNIPKSSADSTYISSDQKVQLVTLKSDPSVPHLQSGNVFDCIVAAAAAAAAEGQQEKSEAMCIDTPTIDNKLSSSLTGR